MRCVPRLTRGRTSSCLAKKKARPLRRPATPGSLRCSFATGGCGTRTFGPQTVLALFPVASCAARRRRGQEEKPIGHQRPAASDQVRDSARCASPSCSAEQRSRAGGRRRALFEGHSPELRSRPARRVAQGSRQSRPRNVVVAFSLASFFWRPKRKNARASGAE